MPTYMSEPWFAILESACEREQRQKVAAALGVSAPVISQVLNGTGKYGTGQAGTGKLAARVMHTYGRWECPHLTAEKGVPTLIEPYACRAFAHRPAPTGSPRDMQHWQACNSCPHKAHTAPVVPRDSKPRGPRKASAEAGASDAEPASPETAPADATAQAATSEATPETPTEATHG